MWTLCRLDRKEHQENTQRVVNSRPRQQSASVVSPGPVREPWAPGAAWEADLGNIRQGTAKQQTLGVACPWVEPRGRNWNVTAEPSLFRVPSKVQGEGR